MIENINLSLIDLYRRKTTLSSTSRTQRSRKRSGFRPKEVQTYFVFVCMSDFIIMSTVLNSINK